MAPRISNISERDHVPYHRRRSWHLSEGNSRRFTPLACGPGFPEFSEVLVGYGCKVIYVYICIYSTHTVWLVAGSLLLHTFIAPCLSFNTNVHYSYLYIHRYIVYMPPSHEAAVTLGNM